MCDFASTRYHLFLFLLRGRAEALSSVPAALHRVAAESIRLEMASSKELTKWPCGMFRALHDGEEQQGHNKMRLPVDRSVLAANCTARYVTCSVRFDQAGG